MSSHEAEILIVDDTPANLDLLTGLLKDRFRVRAAASGRRGLAIARSFRLDLVLLDVAMPEMDGYAVCRALKSEPGTRNVPVIFLSALDGALDKVAAFEAGGADYVAKPFQVAEVMARIEHQLSLARLRRDLERKNEELERTSDRLRRTAAELEESNRQLLAANEKLHGLSYRDGLTGLANRRGFDEAFAEACSGEEAAGTSVSLVLIDLDHFKLLNDTQGHQMGDEALRRIGQVLSVHAAGRGGLVARFGGEEFAWLVRGVALDEVRAGAEELLIAVRSAAIRHDASPCRILTASAGIGTWTASRERRPQELVANADQALYRAKAGGRDRVEVLEAS